MVPVPLLSVRFWLAGNVTPPVAVMRPVTPSVPPIVALLVTLKPRPALVRFSWPAIELAAVPLTVRVPSAVVFPAAVTLKLLEVTVRVLAPVVMVEAAPAVTLIELALCKAMAPAAPLPIVTVPVEVPLLMLVLKLEEALIEAAAPLTVKPPVPWIRPVPELTPTAVNAPVLANLATGVPPLFWSCSKSPPLPPSRIAATALAPVAAPKAYSADCVPLVVIDT